MIKSGVPNSVIINLELIHSPHIRHFEYGLIHSIGFLLQSGADEGVNAHKLQLHIIGLKWLPFAIFQLINFDSVYL